jgi:hypothetical protein
VAAVDQQPQATVDHQQQQYENPDQLPDYEQSADNEDAAAGEGSSSVERKKRQMGNRRPVNIFGLAFGSNQSPQDAPADELSPPAPPPPLSNSDVTFDQNSFESLVQNAMRYWHLDDPEHSIPPKALFILIFILF